MIIKNGRVIDPKSKRDGIFDIKISKGKIEKIGKEIPLGKEKVIDAKGLVVAPGFVDVHVHFRDPGFTHKEDLTTGSQAAIAGGFTSVVCMGNTSPKMDNEETIRDFMRRGKEMPLHLYTVSALTKNFGDRELVDMEKMASLGVVGFSDDGIPNRNPPLILEGMERAKALNLPISFHEEDPSLIAQNGINHGEVSQYFGLYGSPSLAESSFIARDIEFARWTGATIDIQHISTKEGVDLVKYGKEQGVSVYAEVTPHHIALTDKALLKHGSLAKMNPPLRREEDRQRILRGIEEGSIEIIATDHAPHSKEEKDRPLTKAPSGIIGLETALGICYRELVATGRISLSHLIQMMTLNPATLYRLPAGVLAEGEVADITIFDPEKKYRLKTFQSKSSNSPFKDEELQGQVLYTIVAGKIVHSMR
ncbi:MAG: dihydroorotase [Tissierellia bacterium]|nr:dihydroorotase [Tissierellia bacterium]